MATTAALLRLKTNWAGGDCMLVCPVLCHSPKLRVQIVYA
jgi:hypothetical protein